MLYTDRDFIDIDDIASIDPDVIEVCAVENIPTSGSASFVHQAIEECANQLLGDFQSFNYIWNASYLSQAGFSPGLGYDSTPPPRIKLGQVVIDHDTTLYWSPLKRYTCYLALRNFYQICSSRKLDDKYESKMSQIQHDIDRKYLPQLRESGLPICRQPIPCPGALYEVNQGTWTASNVTSVSGGTTDAADWDVALTWQTGQAESGPSETITTTLDDNQLLAISITSLVPPTGTKAWNIYSAPAGSPLRIQASVPIATTAHIFADVPSVTGALVGRGQSRDTSLTFVNLFARG